MKPYYTDRPEWKLLHGEDSHFVKTLEGIVEERWIPSNGSEIHLDIYSVSSEAPTVIYCHGLSSCSRMMAFMLKRLHDRGYNVICPDLKGYGMTVDKVGSGTIEDFVHNVLDVIAFAKQTFKGPRYLTGISMGGALSYYAAAAGADVNAIACFCLMDFSSRDILNISHKGRLISLIKPLLKFLSTVAPHKHIPMRHFINPDRLSTSAEIIKIFKTHPLVIKQYTFKAALSLLTSSPLIPFEEFDRLPTLVLHGHRDRLIPEFISQMNYERIKGLKKYVSLKTCEHVPWGDAVLDDYVSNLDDWFQQYAN